MSQTVVFALPLPVVLALMCVPLVLLALSAVMLSLHRPVAISLPAADPTVGGEGGERVAGSEDSLTQAA